MGDYAPPPGPPPPRVPEGWKAQWNDQYKEWFYVNLHTKQSQWDKPTEPAYPSSGGPPPGAPPGYDSHQPQNTGPEKGGYASNNPYGSSSIHSGGSSQNVNDDEAYARKLQAEEEARARQSGQSTARAGASDSYYNSGAPQYQSQTPQYQSQAPQYQSQSQPQYGNELPPRTDDRGKKGGFLGKLLGKTSGSSSRPNQGYGQQGYASGGYPQQQYGGYPQQGYGGYPPQQAYAQPQRKHGGMGGMGGMALGAGAGLLGGALLMDGIDHMEDNAYEQGYENGGGGDDYGNDDYGGGGDDFGGGDF